MTAILIFQACVAGSLLLAKIIGDRKSAESGKRYALVAAAGWTAETLLYVFWPPLIVLQLLVVWGTFAFLTRTKPPKPIKPSPQAKTTKPPRPPLISREAQWRLSRAANYACIVAFVVGGLIWGISQQRSVIEPRTANASVPTLKSSDPGTQKPATAGPGGLRRDAQAEFGSLNK